MKQSFNELLSLSNQQSGEGDGNPGGGGLWSLQHLLQSWPLGANVAMVYGPNQPREGYLKGEPLVQSNLKGC